MNNSIIDFSDLNDQTLFPENNSNLNNKQSNIPLQLEREFIVVPKTGFNSISILKEFADKFHIFYSYSEEGKDNENRFIINVIIENQTACCGLGHSKSSAKSEASSNALKLFVKKNDSKFNEYLKNKIEIKQIENPSKINYAYDLNLSNISEQISKSETKEREITKSLKSEKTTEKEFFILNEIEEKKPQKLLSPFLDESILDAPSKITIPNKYLQTILDYPLKSKEIIEFKSENSTLKMRKSIIDFYNSKLKISDNNFSNLSLVLEEFLSFVEKTIKNSIKIIPIGSFINNSIRNNKLQIDIAFVYDKNLFEISEVFFEKLKISFERNSENNFKYDVKVSESSGYEKYLLVTYKPEKTISFQIFTREENDLKLNTSIFINKILFQNQEKDNKKLEELKILRSILKNSKDNDKKFKKLTGEEIDYIIYIVTKKFKEIDLVDNLEKFIEFIALGSISCKNSWLWEEIEIPQSIFFNINSSKDLEDTCRAIVKNGDLSFLIKE